MDQACDCNHGTGSPLIPYPEALRLLKESARAAPKRIEEVALPDACNRVLAARIHAVESIPAHDNSAMDGFALRSRDLLPGSNSLRVSGMRIAGDLPGESADAGIAIEIMTGAPLPAGGFDLILKIEDAEVRKDPDGGRTIHFDASAPLAAHVRKRGADYKPGDLLLEAGTTVWAKDLLGLAANGIARVPVFRKPRIALISTGNELVSFETERVACGMIRNSTAPYLTARLSEFGCEVRNFGVVSDEASGEPEEFDRAVKVALAEGFDLILTTGAVSMGVHDFIKTSVVRSGGKVLFHKVAIKPGKPVLFAEFPDHPGTRLLGLPGNPVSTVAGADFFVAPFLRAWFGMAEPAPSAGVLLGAVPGRPRGLRTFARARTSLLPDGRTGLQILPGQDSFMIHSLAQADAWAVFPEDAPAAEGDRIEFHGFQKGLDQ
jgi:molybdopterin molybdotransferase